MKAKLSRNIGNYPIRIAVEGLDGAGKTTQTELLAKSLATQGVKTAVFRYSASRTDFIGRVIKNLYDSKNAGKPIINQLSRLRLFQEILFSLQANLNYNEIKGVNSCKLILLDRCVVTAFVAHTDDAGKLLFSEKIISLLESKFVPHYVIYLSVPLQLAQGRIANRASRSSDEYLEKMKIMEVNYNRIVRGTWRPFILGKIKKWYVVDAHKTVSNTHKQLLGIISEILELEDANNEEM